MILLTLVIFASSSSYVAGGNNSTIQTNSSSEVHSTIILVNTSSIEVVVTSSSENVAASLTAIEKSTVAPSPTATSAALSSSAAPVTPKKVKFQAKAKLQLTGKTFTEDLKNESSSLYKETTKELEEAIGDSLKTKATIKEATYTPGSIIATVVVVFEEELKTSDAVASNFVELFKKVIESGKLGNFTVNTTYINIEETFEAGVTVTDFKVKDDECEKTCCSGDGIINKEITQYRTCSSDDKSKCENVITNRNVLCSIADCCSSASDLLMSPLTTLLALALVFLITG